MIILFYCVYFNFTLENKSATYNYARCKVSNQSVQNIVNNYINVHVSIAVCLLFLLVCSITPTPSFNMIQHRWTIITSSACSIGIPYTKYNTFYWPHCSDSTQAPPPEIWLVVPIFPRLDWHHPHHLSMTRACPAAICFDLISALEPPEIDTTDDR